MTDPSILGLHHVTAIASDPQRNIDFYVGLLGLRLVKRTVNFDDPGAYHFYYGDEVGWPGTLLTFFTWPGARRGRPGTGQIAVTSFSIAHSAIGWWIDRLKAGGVEIEGLVGRFNEEVLSVTDHDGLKLELVARMDADLHPGWEDGPIPAERAIRGIDGVTLAESAGESTARLLERQMGFLKAESTGNRFRYLIGEGRDASHVDLVHEPGNQKGLVAVGTAHHVAFRTSNDETQLGWRTRLVEWGYDVSPVMDRDYFHSIYFREPGGVLFEIATDPPGFAIDEAVTELGTHLKLPPWLEPRRRVIEELLPPIQLPTIQLPTIQLPTIQLPGGEEQTKA